jgi:hypothetical protein
MIVAVIVMMVGRRYGDGLYWLGGLDYGRMAAGKGQQCSSQQKSCQLLGSSHRVVLLAFVELCGGFESSGEMPEQPARKVSGGQNLCTKGQGCASAIGVISMCR